MITIIFKVSALAMLLRTPSSTFPLRARLTRRLPLLRLKLLHQNRPRRHLDMIEAIFTKQGMTIEEETQRRINTVNMMTAYLIIQDKRMLKRPQHDPPEPCSPAKKCSSKTILLEAAPLVHVTSKKDRPLVCFLCIGNPNLAPHLRTLKHKTPGSLTSASNHQRVPQLASADNNGTTLGRSDHSTAMMLG